MGEREPQKEIINKGELYFLWHPSTEDVFSGYGLTMKADSKEHLVGLLMVDRPPQNVDAWLQDVAEAFGSYRLVAMTASGERGILCQMQIESQSQPFLRQFPFDKAAAIESALQPLLDEQPNPTFMMNWDDERQVWVSQLVTQWLFDGAE